MNHSQLTTLFLFGLGAVMVKREKGKGISEKGEFSPVRNCTRLIRLTSNGPGISELGD